MQRFTHAAALIFQMRILKVWECSIFKIMLTGTCLMRLSKQIGTAGTMLPRFTLMDEQMAGEIVSCHCSLYIEGRLSK